MASKHIWYGLALGLLLFPVSGKAEYWLSNRFAQNCAGCHAPGRVNKRASERRCTLSCQGCHVNPNGGGIVSAYGAWNEERWLRSFYFDGLLTNKRRPATFAQQVYAKKSAGAKGAMQPVMVTKDEDGDERLYDRSDRSEQIVASTEEEFLERVPQNDPYRQEMRNVVTGGMNLRYMSLAYTSDPPPRLNKTMAWLMSVDVGARFRPVPRHFQLAMEARFLNQPLNTALDQVFTTETRVRSAYALFDEIPYNTYFMYGLYRPMLGLYNPDHDSLANMISGVRQRSVYRGAGIGMAPNVPFFNLNYIQPLHSTLYDQSEGFAANVGARWVTLGASLVLSYWNTHVNDTAGNQLSRQILALTTGVAWMRFVWNTEMMYIKREFAPGSYDSGNVFTSQLKYRLWRENYAELNFAFANTAMNLKNGASSELELGFRSFLAAGTDVELLFVSRKNETPSTSSTSTGFQWQLHLFL